MKALSLIGMTLAAFLIILGFLSRATAGILSNALIIGGAIVMVFLAIIWMISFLENKKRKDKDYL